jgi:tetratricopeptide (TPR) repeat protein
LDRTDAIALVSEVMKQEGLEPKADDPGGTPKEIEELVDAVNCHARALELLARELAKQGVQATTENLHRLMAELDRRHPGDRQNSLYASIELSLRRLPPEMREQAKVLAVFHGGANLWVLGYVLEIAKDDTETVRRLAAALIDVGLAEDMGYAHLKLDPALPSYMLRELSEAEIEATRVRWAEAMQKITAILYEDLYKDAKLAALLTQFELPNLMAMLLWLQDRTTPEAIIYFACRVEQLVSTSGGKSALAQAVKLREQAALKLSGWSHARYLTESATIERLLDQGNRPAAHAAAEQLVRRCMEAGVGAYPEADYDIALAYLSLGRVSQVMGAAEIALRSLEEAQRRFEYLAKNGDVSAEGMYVVSMMDTADSLTDLGRLDEAASLYDETIRRSEKLHRQRDVAVSKFQLGTLRIRQNRHDDALKAFEETLPIFESLGEPGSIASVWYQIGMVHRKVKRFDLAEQAYRQSLATDVKTKNVEEARSLSELANLYADWGRLEEAVTFFKQAADAHNKQQNLRSEGLVRSNLANTLLRLQRYDEARSEVHRAIECKAPLGHAAQIWKTWGILCNLEVVTGNHPAADVARQKAIQSYLAYRRAGGVSQNNLSELFALVSHALQDNQAEVALQKLAQISSQDIPQQVKSLITKLQTILRGDRSLDLIDDPSLSYTTIVELLLLLEPNPLPNT